MLSIGAPSSQSCLKSQARHRQIRIQNERLANNGFDDILREAFSWFWHPLLSPRLPSDLLINGCNADERAGRQQRGTDGWRTDGLTIRKGSDHKQEAVG